MTAAIVPARDLARFTDVQLLESYHRDHKVAARDELVRRFMPFARKLAMRYLHSREPLDDLVQVANLGLLNAIDRFEPGRGRSFTAYAAPTILGELKRHFRDKSWSVHVPRELKERALASSRYRERLYVELGRCPTVDELADALRCTIAQTIEALDAAENYHPQSLDAPGGDDDEEGMPLLELLGDFDDGFGLAEDSQSLATGWRTLSDTERHIVGLRLLHGLTQREISRRVGCSQMHVSRLLSRSIRRLNPPDGSATPALAVASRSARQAPSARPAPRVLESLETGPRM
jgi:RNA polymerase sigma-B factor